MVKVPIFDIAKIGVISDLPDHHLPPEAWTDALNIRFIDNKIVRATGSAEVMDPPSVAPGFVFNVEGSAGVFWLYASAVGAGSKVYAFNSGTHADISKAGDYSISEFRLWNSCVFHGTPIINPVNSAPQYWASLNLATDLADLPNWPASTTAQIIRVYKNYLMALYITDGGGTHEHRLLWSDRASAGSLPGSWDDTDPTVDAGIWEFSDVNSGVIVDALALRDMFAVYKNDSTWLTRFKGGQDIMEHANVLQTSGLLARRCMTPLTLPIDKSQVHFLHNGTDLGHFNGQSFESVIQSRVRKRLLSDIDAINYQNSFVFDNPTQDEAWFCYPEEGAVHPTKACVWNYRENTIRFCDFDGVHASSGAVELAGSSTWAAVTGTWNDQDASKWQEGARRKIVVADQANTKLLTWDTNDTFNGTSYTSMVERTGLAIVGRDRMGNPKVDYERRKLITRVWPKIKGGRVRVTIGKLEKIGDEELYVWTRSDGKNTAIFDPSDAIEYVDVINDGRLLAIRFEGIDGDYWEMSGYDIDVVLLGSN